MALPTPSKPALEAPKPQPKPRTHKTPKPAVPKEPLATTAFGLRFGPPVALPEEPKAKRERPVKEKVKAGPERSRRIDPQLVSKAPRVARSVSGAGERSIADRAEREVRRGARPSIHRWRDRLRTASRPAGACGADRGLGRMPQVGRFIPGTCSPPAHSRRTSAARGFRPRSACSPLAPSRPSFACCASAHPR